MLTCALLLALTFQASSTLSPQIGSKSLALLPNGQWEPSFQHVLTGFPPILPRFNAAHMAVIPKGPHRGKIIAWDIRADSTSSSWLQRWSIIDVAAQGGPVFLNYLLAMPAGEGDLFCAGLAWTGEGDLLVVGGTTAYPGLVARPLPIKKPLIGAVGPTPCAGTGCSRGTPTSSGSSCSGCGAGCGCGCLDGSSTYLGGKLTYLWHPDDSTWYQQPDMAIDRWYPTALLRGNGSLIVAGGITGTGLPIEEGNNYEVFVQTGTNPPTGAWQQPQLFPGPSNFVSMLYIYPRMYTLTTGEAFLAGMTSHSAKLEHTSAPGIWVKGRNSSFDTRIYETTVLMPYVPDPLGTYTDEVLILGGIGIEFPKVKSTTGGGAITGNHGVQSSVQVSHPTAVDQRWSARPSMAHARKYANGVLLADGSLFVVGGNSGGGVGGGVVLNPELYDGTSWTQLPPHDSPRTYHSTAVLLPDGSVLSAGGNTATRDYQIYKPAYLTSGDPRPVISAAPATMGYYAENPAVHSVVFEPMPAGHSVERAVLISPGAVTHHTDCNQRYVQLILDTSSADHIDVLAPANRNLVPPGYYMLFLLSAAGVPSEAAWVKVQ